MHQLVVRALLDRQVASAVGQLCKTTSLCERTVKFVLVDMVDAKFVSRDCILRYSLHSHLRSLFS